LALLLVTGLGSVATAQDGLNQDLNNSTMGNDRSIEGTVVSSSPTSLVVRTDAGQEMTFFITDANDVPAGTTAGQRIRVNYDTDQADATRFTVSNVTLVSSSGTTSGTTTGSSYDANRYGSTSTTTTTTNQSGSSYGSDWDRNMPGTASPLAMIGLGGLVALGAARIFRRRNHRDEDQDPARPERGLPGSERGSKAMPQDHPGF